MSYPSPATVAFLGAGNIAVSYANSLGQRDDLRIVGVFDLDETKRDELAARTGGQSYPTMDALVADKPDLVVNLTSAPHHYATTGELIRHGLDVFTEKPLALTYLEATELVSQAEQAGVRLGCAPSLWLSPAARRAAAEVRAGRVGDVRLVTAEVHQGRIESWHPAPETFYRIGPVVDAGIYPLTLLTATLGPIAVVSAVSGRSLDDRSTLDGAHFTPGAPDTWLISGVFRSGALLQLTCSFYVDAQVSPRSVQWHGHRGSLRLDDWMHSGAGIWAAEFGSAYQQLVEPDPEAGIDWGLGVVDLIEAGRAGRPHLTDPAQAAHLVEVLEAVAASASRGEQVAISSVFTPAAQ